MTAVTSLNYAEAAAGAGANALPRAARKLLPQVIKEANYRQLDAAVVAGQIHQESGWDSSAASAYARGLAQFTPETERWMRKTYPAELGAGAGAASPAWAIRAMCLYDRWLMDRVDQRWPLALRAYNGGLGWIIRERVCNLPSLPALTGVSLLAADGIPAPSAADFECCRRFRSAASCRENLEYPILIIKRHAPLYRAIINHFGSGA